MTSEVGYVVVIRHNKRKGGDFVSAKPFYGLFGWYSLSGMCKTLGVSPHVKRCKGLTLEDISRETEANQYLEELQHHGATRLEEPEPILFNIPMLVEKLLGI